MVLPYFFYLFIYLQDVYFNLCFRDDAYDILAVADWGQKLSFYQLSGKQVGGRFEVALSYWYNRVLSDDHVKYFNMEEIPRASSPLS